VPVSRVIACLACAMFLAPFWGLAGCGGKKQPPPLEFAIHTPYSTVKTLALAPAINLSGSRDFDPLVVSDTLFAEMQQVEDLNVIPLNKTLIAMERLGIHSIEDPKTAQKLAEALGADGLVIPAVTAYDPYDPPTVGMILQMYTPVTPPPPQSSLPPPRTYTTLSNPGNPVVVADANPAGPSVAEPSGQPVSQVSAVFNGSNQTVLKELEVFASGRTRYDSAAQERQFLLDSDAYMRFVCHAMVRRLMDVERERLSDR
jgi:hypothetical protein